MRVITSSPPRTRSVPLFRMMRFLNIFEINMYMTCVFIYRNLNTPNSPCSSFFNFYRGTYNTRYNNENNLIVPRIDTRHSRQNITYRGPKLYNDVPLIIKSCNSLVMFKSKIKQHILSN